ncbi:hypothetical protein [Halobacterium zhouii]|uniref:hypothetical protein n=1 Tax=Halobacterium zhouii TaxID=2902624 RepID=UPI001E2FE4B0|nr:hypothetical protein [Halobacterium zhouii]
MKNLDEEELFTHIDSGQFIDHYVDRFVQDVETDRISTYEFDRMLLAEGGEGNIPGEVIWGAIRDFSKHIGMLSDIPDDAETIRDVQRYLQHLNANPNEQAVSAFFTYLQENYESITTISENALIEIPDPTAPKIGDYPVVDVILYAHPDGTVMKTVEATLYSASFSVDDPDAVFDHVSQKIPSRDVGQYADDVYQATVEEFRTRLTSNLIDNLDRETLTEAGYTELKEEPIPEDINRLHAGKTASYWQKEIWNVDGVDATTGFARIWFLPDEEVGVVGPSAGDFDTDTAISRIKAELQ